MKAFFIVGFVCFLLALNIFVGGVSVEYLVEFWGTHLQSHPVNVPFFPCAIAGAFLGQFAIPLAVLTWVLSFVI